LSVLGSTDARACRERSRRVGGGHFGSQGGHFRRLKWQPFRWDTVWPLILPLSARGSPLPASCSLALENGGLRLFSRSAGIQSGDISPHSTLLPVLEEAAFLRAPARNQGGLWSAARGRRFGFPAERADRPNAPFTTALPQHVGKDQPLAERGCGGEVAGFPWPPPERLPEVLPDSDYRSGGSIAKTRLRRAPSRGMRRLMIPGHA